jgi:CHAT domain-containing protein
MNTIEGERGRTLNAQFGWVDFVVRHPDILAALNQSPLRAAKTEGNKYLLTIFGVRVLLEEVHHQVTEKQGTLKWFADIRLPWGLGKTHTLTTYHYFVIDEATTSVELTISIELTTLLMRWYAARFQARIDRYLNKVCRHIEHAAQMLGEGKEDAAGTLNNDQQERIAERRQALRRSLPKASAPPQMEGILRVLMSEDAVFVTAEARMPDHTFLSAKGQFGLKLEEKQSLRSGMVTLAGINNRALGTRGKAEESTASVDFRQAALEYGYTFYQKVCANQLASVVPVITSQGRSAILRITVEGEAEQLPWEVMHDGQEFLCIKTCLTRSVTNLRPASNTPREWDQAGILIVGADSRGDLPGVEQEVRGIGRLLGSAGVTRADVLTGQKANRRSVLKALQSGEFTLLHFSGHSVFDTDYPYQSYLELCGGTKIFLHELGHFSHATQKIAPLSLVFLNSCQTARVGQDSLTGKQLSMCKTLRESGVCYVIGMLWNVEDDAAVQVGAGFYGNLMSSPQISPESAMREARLSVAIDRAWADGSWLAPVLYS